MALRHVQLVPTMKVFLEQPEGENESETSYAWKCSRKRRFCELLKLAVKSRCNRIIKAHLCFCNFSNDRGSFGRNVARQLTNIWDSAITSAWCDVPPPEAPLPFHLPVRIPVCAPPGVHSDHHVTITITRNDGTREFAATWRFDRIILANYCFESVFSRSLQLAHMSTDSCIISAILIFRTTVRRTSLLEFIAVLKDRIKKMTLKTNQRVLLK